MRCARGSARALFCAAALGLAGILPAAAARAAAPTLTSVKPQTFAPGATLTLRGSGFGPAPDGAEVVLLGPDVGEPVAAATVVSWSDDEIVATAPVGDIWPGAASIEVLPAGGAAPSGQLSVDVVAPGGAVTDPEAAWIPSGAGGALDVGWYDAAGVPATPLTLALPLATPGGGPAFNVPPSLPPGAVTLDGAPAPAAVGSGTLTWPDGSQTPAAVLTLQPGASVPPGPVTISISAAAGLQAPDGVYAVGIGTGATAVPIPLDVSPLAAAGFRVTVPASVTPGVPFPVEIQAVDGAGGPAAAAPSAVYLSSSGGALDFTGATPTLDGPTTVEAGLVAGGAQVTAVAGVAGTVTVTAQSASGLSGQTTLSVAPPAAGGVQVEIFPPFSGFTGGTAFYEAANVETLGLRSGVRSPGPPGPGAVYAGWWPLGVGKPYEAQWSGELTVRPAPALPAPLPQPQEQFAFLDVAARVGASATLQPVPGTGASVDGGSGPLDLAAAAAGAGPAEPTVATLTPGRYQVTVQAPVDAVDGGGGDTLYYSEAFTAQASSGAGSIFSPGAATLWSPLAPVPPGAFTGAGLPDPALSVAVGAPTADARGADIPLLSPARIVGGRTLLPLRAVAQALGAVVSWNPATGGIAVSGGGHTAQLTIGADAATVDGAPVTLDEPATLVPPGVTLVPLRFLGQALGWQVGWDAASSTAVLLPPLTPEVPGAP